MNKIIKQGVYNVEWIAQNILSHPIGAEFAHLQTLPTETIFNFKSPTSSELLDDFLQNHDPDYINTSLIYRGYDLTISEYLQEELLGAPFNVIDFKRHLAPPYSVNKKVTLNEEFRPLLSEYFIKNSEGVEVLVAKIIFVFRNLINSPLMSRRTEVLYYTNLDGTFTPPIVIKDKTYELDNPNDLSVMMGERVDSRERLLSYINSQLLGVLASTQGLSAEEVALLVKPFTLDIKESEQEFIHIGTSTLLNQIRSIDLETTPHQWLNTLLAPDYNAKDFLLDKLDYVSGETYLDFDYGVLE